jgi:hypothetical protein
MYTKQYTSQWFRLGFTLLLAVIMVLLLLGATWGSTFLFSAKDLPFSAAACNWPYKGMTYVSWTRGEYPWATSWQAQTYVDSQAISHVSITTTCPPYEGQGSLALTVDLIGGHPNKSNGETFVDLRYHPPLMESTCCLSTPLNLEGIQVSAQVFCPAGSRGDPSRPNGLQLFAKSIDSSDNWWSFYGDWHNIQENLWNEVTMTPSTVTPPEGYKDPLFDPTQIVALGLKIGAGGGSTATFSGTCCLDNVRWSAGCAEARYGFENVENALDQLDRTHANYVSLIVTWYMDEATSTSIYSDTQRTHTDEEIAETIQEIHKRGMGVMLKPHVDVQDDTWRGEIVPSDPGAWFASYESFITRYADIAEANNVELFSIGTEFASLSGNSYAAHWNSVIDAIKSHYSGLLTYAANWGTAPNAEYMNVSFWDRLNLAGIDAYFPLSDEPDPTLEQLIAGWSNYHGNCWVCDIEAWQATLGKPVIFTEIGYGSRDYAAREPWLADIGTPNCALQARAYQAAVEVFKDKPWFLGMFWWAWTPFSDAGGCCNRGFTPQNKPAVDFLTCTYGYCLRLPVILKGSQ